MIADNSTTRFERLTVKGFRRLHDVQIPLRSLSVMVGANGTGKTSVLDVLSLLANSAQGRLNDSITDLSGIQSVLSYDGSGELALGIDMKVPDHSPLKYSLKLRPQGFAYSVSEERLSQRNAKHSVPFLHIDAVGQDIKFFDVEERKLVRPGKKRENETLPDQGAVRPNWDYKPFETSLSQVPKMFREPEDFRNRLASSTFYHVLNVDSRAPVRLPQPMRPALLPGQNGEDIVSCLFYLRETNRSRFEAVEDVLRAGFPRFERLDFPPVAAGTLSLTWREKGLSQPFYMHQLSEGTLRFLWLITLLNSPGLTALTLLDEPEVSLHPDLLRLLADLLREASERTQIVVATHSDRLIRFLNPEEVLLLDSAEDGFSSLKWADELDLEAWLKEYSLDELWSNGRLGARP